MQMLTFQAGALGTPLSVPAAALHRSLGPVGLASSLEARALGPCRRDLRPNVHRPPDLTLTHPETPTEIGRASLPA